ncbi:NUDIX hydrolase [Sphingomonas sp. NPDC019816]|uniref:NUDIX hydrolase n=1 Tax=Sphingomonas sp. NPDC019816 TaxID=3390679 RepID=UPI003D035B60
MMTEPAIPDTIPAASLILMRDSADLGEPPEILMVERGASLAFLGGAMVFPGGRIDPGDRAMVAKDDPDGEDTAARIAAIRETIEETGLAVGLAPLPRPDVMAALRDGVRQRRRFADVLAEHGLALDRDALTPFARWCPEHVPVRRFDARFYLAEIARHNSAPVIDGDETVAALWLSARAALSRADQGAMRIIYPTRRMLERLALHRDVAAALADARGWPVRRIVPFLAERDGVPSICIPEDLGFPITAEPVSTAERG